MKRRFLLAALLLGTTLIPFVANAANVALNASVTLHGTFFTDGWGGGIVVPPERIVNGSFADEQTQWDQDAVWWDGHYYPENSIQIDLVGVCNIMSFVVQADNNDSYRVSYLGSDDNWHVAYEVPSVGGWGLMTREEFILDAPIQTSALKFEATEGDDYYSVSQIVANGSIVPLPTTMILLGSGLIGLVGIKRKFE